MLDTGKRTWIPGFVGKRTRSRSASQGAEKNGKHCETAERPLQGPLQNARGKRPGRQVRPPGGKRASLSTNSSPTSRVGGSSTRAPGKYPSATLQNRSTPRGCTCALPPVLVTSLTYVTTCCRRSAQSHLHGSTRNPCRRGYGLSATTTASPLGR